MEKISHRDLAVRVSVLTIIVNVVLAVFKLVAGIVANSGALISDAVHSASDVFSTFIVIIGVNLSNKESDKEHQYGHERMESVAAIILAVILFVTGLAIGWSGFKKILAGNYQKLVVPGLLALIAAFVSIVVKEWMYWYTRAAAKKINSGALMADAWHHRSDALSSVGSLAGVAGARLGYPILDSVASVIISIIVLKVAIDIFVDAMNKMVDKSVDEDIVKRMEEIIRDTEGVVRIDKLKTRLFGAKAYVDIDIAVDGTISLDRSHAIAKQVHDAIENEFPDVKHCMVHVNPAEVSTEGPTPCVLSSAASGTSSAP